MTFIRTSIVLIALLLAMGCGGSGTSPDVWDLTGLAGIWDFTYNIQGKLVPDQGDDLPISYTYTGFLTITKTTVTDDDGEAYSWAYDGTTLTLKLSDIFTEFDPDCGDMLWNTDETYVTTVTSGQTAAAVNGTLLGTVISQFCGDLTITLTATGTAAKR